MYPVRCPGWLFASLALILISMPTQAEGSADPRLIAQATGSLRGSVTSPTTAEECVQELEAPDEVSRVHAIRCLSSFHALSPSIAPALARLLGDPRQVIIRTSEGNVWRTCPRDAALAALTEMALPAARALRNALADTLTTLSADDLLACRNALSEIADQVELDSLSLECFQRGPRAENTQPGPPPSRRGFSVPVRAALLPSYFELRDRISQVRAELARRGYGAGPTDPTSSSLDAQLQGFRSSRGLTGAQGFLDDPTLLALARDYRALDTLVTEPDLRVPLQQFQNDRGLPPSGVLDPQTRDALGIRWPFDGDLQEPVDTTSVMTANGVVFGTEVRSNYIVHRLIGGDSSHEDFLDGYYFRKRDWVAWGCCDLVGKSVRITYRLSDDPTSSQRINVVTSIQPEQ